MRATCCQLSKSRLPGEVLLAESARPRVARDEVRIAPLLVGLCGSDLRLLRNEKAHLPGVFGHEVVARVAEAGEAVDDFRAGDLVTVNPVNSADDGDIIGYNGAGFLTTDFIVGRDVLEQGRLLPLPAGTAAEEAVFAEPLACCVRAQRELGEGLRGARVVVVGAGSFGLLHCLLARASGASQVILATRGRARADEALRRGVVGTGEVVDVHERAHPLSGRAQVLIVTANGVGAIRDALHWAEPGARLLLFGGLESGDAHDGIDFGRLRRSRGRVRATVDGKPVVVVGSYGTANEDFSRAIGLIASGELRLRRLISHDVPLAALPSLLDALAQGVIDGRPVLKLVVRP